MKMKEVIPCFLRYVIALGLEKGDYKQDLGLSLCQMKVKGLSN